MAAVSPQEPVPRPAPTGPNAARRRAARENKNHDLPEARDLRFDLRFRAVADADHRDHRGDTDDDAERGQGRAQLVAPQGAERNSQGGAEAHVG